MTLARYPEYQESGSEWLGKIPKQWKAMPLKWAVEGIESGTSVNAIDLPRADDEFAILKTSCVYGGWFDWAENKTVVEEDLDRVSCPLKRNTLIVSRMNTPELVGAAGLVDQAPSGIFLPDRLWQVTFAPQQLPRFFDYFTKSKEYRGQIKQVCSGTSSSMQNLGQEDFKGILVAVPTELEQIQIARFLDHETAKIDALIHEQERLIELLQEKRQAVISHAVTKGLDPDVPMKDSGVEWLGEVPAHWTIRKGSYIGRLFGSDPIPENMVSEEEGQIPFLKVASLSSNTIDVVFWGWFVSSEYRGALRPAEKFIVFPKRGAAIFLNKVNVINRKAVIDPNLMGWEVSGEHLTEFYAHALKCRGLSELADVSTVPQINNKHVAPEVFPVPPIDEQREIVRFLEANIQEMEQLNESAKNFIDLLKERRSALISAAVTGKIDVRDWRPPADESAYGEEVRQTGMEATV